LYQNAFDGLAPPAPAGGARPIQRSPDPVAIIRGKGKGSGKKGLGIGKKMKAGYGRE